MTSTEKSLREQIADHYETYMRENATAKALLDSIAGCDCDEDCECTTGSAARAEAAIHAGLAQAAASMANTLALIMAREPVAA